MPKTIHRPEYRILRDLVRESRLAAGITQVELSKELGRSQSFISDVERGTRRLDVLELRDLCHLLGRDLAQLLAEFEVRVQTASAVPKRARRVR